VVKPASRRTAEPSEEEEEVVEAVGMRSISWLRRPGGVLIKRSGEASRSLRCISRSASFILAVVLDDSDSEEFLNCSGQLRTAQEGGRACYLF
jgi:hypothetical protein